MGITPPAGTGTGLSADLELLSSDDDKGTEPKTQEEALEADEKALVEAMEKDDEEEGQKKEESGEEQKKDDDEGEESEEDLAERIKKALEEEEEEDDEKEEGEEEEEEEEDKPAIGRPSFKEITGKFPELLKEFPQFREIYFREQAFSNVYATVEEAREASDKAEALDDWDRQLAHEGNIVPLFANLPDEAMAKIASEALPALASRSSDLYVQATAPVLKSLLVRVADSAEKAGNENLYNSVVHLHNHLFDTPDLKAEIPGVKTRRDPPSAKEKEADRRIQEADKRDHDNFTDSVQATTHKLVIKDLERTFDPNKVLPKRVRNSLIRDIIEEVDSQIASDEKHMARAQKLMRQAAQKGFTNEYKTRLISAYLGAFKSLVGPVRQRIRSEALSELKTGTKEKKDKKLIPEGSSARRESASSGEVNPDDVDWSKTSDEDFLNDRITFKKGR